MKVNNYPLKTPSAGDKLFGSDVNGDQKQFDIEDFTSQSTNKLSVVGIEFFNPVISHTGDTDEHLLYSFKIPANYFSIGDIMGEQGFSLNIKLEQITGGAILKMYFNTVDSLTGAQLIQTESASPSGISDHNIGFNYYGYFSSNVNFKALNNDNIPVMYDDIIFPDISNDFYILYSVELNSPSDILNAYFNSGPIVFKPY
jgi:hypothetical protein